MPDDRNRQRESYGFKLRASARKLEATALAPLVADFKKNVLPEIRDEQRKKEVGAVKARRHRID